MPHHDHPESSPKDHRYEQVDLDLSIEVDRPKYASILEWMKKAESKALAFDLWARGNYTRRLIHNRNEGATSIIVPFQYVDELRWAHRRLSLMGLEAEYIYTGSLGSVDIL